MNTPIDIAALEALEKKLPSRPWKHDNSLAPGHVWLVHRGCMAARKLSDDDYSALCDLRNTASQLLSELKELRDRERIAVEALEFLLEAHFTVSEATVPKAGIEANPEQVVFNASISYLRLKRAREALAAIREKGKT